MSHRKTISNKKTESDAALRQAQGAVQHDIPFFYYRIIKTILNNHKQP